MTTYKTILSLILLICLSNSSLSCNADCQHGKHWPSAIVTYAFVGASYTDEDLEEKVYGFQYKAKGITALQAKMLTRQAAATWSCLSQLKLTEVRDPKQAQIRIGMRELEGLRAGFGYFPGGRALDGDIHMDCSNRKWTKELFYKVILHEMGHSLGLLHNQDKQSIMYYKISDVKQPATIDIACLQSLYGAPAPVLTKKNGKMSWEVAQFNNKPVPHYQAEITQLSATEGQVVKVTITSTQQLQNFTVSANALKSANAGQSFFKSSRGWKNMSANAKDNRNQSLRISSEKFIATETSKWAIERAYLFHGSESVRYLASIDGGKNYITLDQERGSSERSEYRKIAKKRKSSKNIDLSRFAGQEVMLVIEYKNKGLYWNSSSKGLTVSNISLAGILKQEQVEQQTIAATSPQIASNNKKAKYIRVSANYGSTRSWSASKKK